MATGALSVFLFVPLSAGAVTLQGELKGLLANHPRLAAEQSLVKSADAKID
jgi:hypothetical protein